MNRRSRVRARPAPRQRLFFKIDIGELVGNSSLMRLPSAAAVVVLGGSNGPPPRLPHGLECLLGGDGDGSGRQAVPAIRRLTAAQ